MAEDIYDFSGISLDDLGSMPSATSSAFSSSSASFFMKEDDFDDDNAEWFPPTPPPYDVAEKLFEANETLDRDPISSVHVADRLRWRSESSLVEIRWLHGGGVGAGSAGEEEEEEEEKEEVQEVLSVGSGGREEIVILGDLAGLRLGATETTRAEVHPNPFDLAGSGGSGSDGSESISMKTSNGLNDDGGMKDAAFVSASPARANYVPMGNNTNGTSRSRRKAIVEKSNGEMASSKDIFRATTIPSYYNTTTESKSKLSEEANKKLRIKVPKIGEQQRRISSRHFHDNSFQVRSRSLEKKQSSAFSYKVTTHPCANSCQSSSDSSSDHPALQPSRIKRMPNSHSLPDLNGSRSRSASTSPAPPRRPLSLISQSSSTIIPISANELKVPASAAAPRKKAISFRSNNGEVVPSVRSAASSLSAPPPLLRRKISRNSLSSNSSLSSYSTTTEDSDSSRKNQREAADQAFLQWVQRKKEEKRLRERRTYLQIQIRK